MLNSVKVTNVFISTTLLKRRDNNVYIHKKKIKCRFYVTSHFNLKAESSTVLEIKLYLEYIVSALWHSMLQKKEASVHCVFQIYELFLKISPL